MTDVPPLIRSLVDASLDAASVVDRELNVLYFNSNYLANRDRGDW